jgi:hypothetical protein
VPQKFEDGKIHPVRFVSRELNPVEWNCDVYDKEMLPVVFSMRKDCDYLQGEEHKTPIFSDHQNLTYFKSAILLNRRQARWSEKLKQYNFQLLYRKGTSNAKADILSRCPVFTSTERDTTSAMGQTMLGKEELFEVGAMELDLDDDIEAYQISAMEVEQLLQEARQRIMEKAMLDEKYRELFKPVSSEGIIDTGFSIINQFLCWKNGIYVPEGLQQREIQSENDSNVAGHFGRERMLQLVTRNFY